MPDKDYDLQYAAYQLKSSRSRIRSRVRALYLSSIAARVTGPAIDFGCGMGGLLALLPEGSCGIDVNPHAVAHCRSRGLLAYEYTPSRDAYRFDMLEPGRCTTFILNHVLEHMEDAAGCFAAMAASCMRLGVRRIILVVPQKKGFFFDTTHRTFIDENYLRRSGLTALSGYAVSSVTSFPFPEFMGTIFTHNELRIIYDAI